MISRRYALRALSIFAVLALVLAACGQAATPAPTQETGGGAAPTSAAGVTTVEIFSWWTTGGEATGLEMLMKQFNDAHPGVDVVNEAVAGGAGSDAKAVLKTRMLGGDPPDSFQVHMGHELIDTWVTTDYMVPLDDLYQANGWTTAFPQGVLDIVSYNGSYWSVPVNIHRANVLWYNKQVFADNNLTPPTTFDEFKTVAEALKAKGIAPLAIGDNGIWASTNLFETVLVGTLGADAYKGLWTGQTDWNSPEVTQAINNFWMMYGYANSDHASLTWDQAADLLIDGKAAMTIMGDWVAGEYGPAGKNWDGYGWALAPGNTGIFDALSDTFGIPKNSKNPDLTGQFLTLLGSKDGQELFNPLKGSICARTDCDPSKFSAYSQSAMTDWQKDTIVPSLAHGAAASETWLTAVNDGMTAFVASGDVPTFQSALAQACIDAEVCSQ